MVGRGILVLRALFGAVVFWGFIWLLYVGILADHGTLMTTQATVPSAGIFQHWKFIGRESHHINEDFKINYVSKRRVPNGPDPIHNRRASQSREPPGRS